MHPWINPQTNRDDLADLVQDLLGDWTLVRCWGAVGSRRGRLRVTAVDSEAAGLALIAAIGQRRRQHGYRPEVDASHAEVSA